PSFPDPTSAPRAVPMPIASRLLGRGLFAAVLFTATFVLLVAARWETFFGSPVYEAGDLAVNALQVEYARHFAELYGNYSRFEFNHPGPAFFYVYAAFQWLLCDLIPLCPSPHNAHLLACVALQSFFFALALGILRTHVRRPLF